MNNLTLLILGMAAVTYIPRLLPFFLVDDERTPDRMNAFLKCVPVAAIGALIIPGVFSAVPGEPAAGIWGMGFALVFGLWRGGVIIPVLGAVSVAYLILTLAS